MSGAPIFFQFDSRRAALLALDTMEELGYRVSLHPETERPTLHVMVDRNDLTSALEIAQAHGGELAEGMGAADEHETYSMAYDMESMIPIPAHIVNEDWADSELERSASDYVNKSSGAYNDETGKFDPSDEDYDRFDAGVHL